MFSEMLGTLFYYFLLSAFFMAGNALSAYGGVNVYEQFNQHALPQVQRISERIQRALDQCQRKVPPNPRSDNSHPPNSSGRKTE